jgi:hypothetical protein
MVIQAPGATQRAVDRATRMRLLIALGDFPLHLARILAKIRIKYVTSGNNSCAGTSNVNADPKAWTMEAQSFLPSLA